MKGDYAYYLEKAKRLTFDDIGEDEIMISIPSPSGGWQCSCISKNVILNGSGEELLAVVKESIFGLIDSIRKSASQKLADLEKAPEPKSRAVKRGFVYLARNPRNGLTKIGFSQKPTLREKTLQSEEPEVFFLLKFHGTQKDEEALHSAYDGSRVRGEWFNLDESNIDAIKQKFSREVEAR